MRLLTVGIPLWKHTPLLEQSPQWSLLLLQKSHTLWDTNTFCRGRAVCAAGLVPSFDPEVVAATDAAELATVPSFELPDVMVPEISGFDLPEVPVAEQAEEEEEEAETAPSRKRPAPFASQEPQPKVSCSKARG